MTPWTPWDPRAFARAKAQGKPVLAAAGRKPPRELEGAAAELDRLFALVLADPELRPDAAARVGEGLVVVLDPRGARVGDARLSAQGVLESLRTLARAAAEPKSAADASGQQPVWTGAVRETPLKAAPGAKELDEAFGRLASAGASGTFGVEALLHAAAERGDLAAGRALTDAIERRLKKRDPVAGGLETAGEPPLSLHARWAALLWDAHAATGEPRWKAGAAELTEHLLRRHFDKSAGAFRRAPGEAVYPAEGNAQAASALLRAHAFGVPGAADAANAALSFLETRLYDPLLGLLHASGGGGDEVCGLLSDASWTALAFTDAYLATGIKAHRDFGDGLLRFLFQELWEREAGGFLDRVPRADDPLVLREPLVDPALNAVALEVCRRLHHLKGNHNYRRWLEWGLRGAWPADGVDPEGAAALARAADLHARGRLDLELVGKAGEPRAEALLAAAHRLYLPRKVISFVDPDDQDYILAHKLEADAYPRLFACAADLRRVADAGDPAGVPALAAALKEPR